MKLRLVSDGGFRLDGGAMFGVVPKVLWAREKAPDENNRIAMATNCLLIESAGDLVLVDTGLGDKHAERFRQNYAFEPRAGHLLPDSIRAAGLELEDVTHVVLSHLHFDHCGWNTRERDGKLVPTFPRARYWLCRGEVEHARAPTERDRASYDPRNWEPLFEAGAVELFDDEAEVIAGVVAVKAPGHNADMCIVTFESDGERGVYWADLVPTAAHVPLPWIMGYDLFPLSTLESKRRWLPRAAQEGWLCVFEHDAEIPLGTLESDDKGRLRARPRV
jgi:glyoxylase-like metal-dependent hydrolase (beta-lactamase superfamily II)